MAEPIWTGPAVAVVTLFDEKGRLLAAETGAHAARLVAAGMRAVVVAGSTGEAATLTDPERAELVAAVRAACPGVPVLAGSSGEWYGMAVERTAAVLEAGADAVLVAPPRLGGDLAVYYDRVAEAAAGAPVLAYHYPGVAGGPVPVDALAGLPVQGIKDSSAEPARLAKEIELGGKAVYTGAAALLGYAAWLGATGAIVAAGNLVPTECLAAWAGDAGAQREVARAEAAYKARPGGLKAALAEVHGTAPTRRLG
ncbi:dihydrodipicolinate synthase family protein [Actinoplanes sp. NPDC049265]|uniref:dihydrodipicolinate synthase family protein n=1 Tax=Actinoplanes sp. NPDC049265 TaxID=3363902 RepID=UPI0037191496